MKKIKINKLTQQVAADILSSFALCASVDDVKRVSDRIMAKYGLCKDPFTGFALTPKEYRENQYKRGEDICVVCGAEVPEGQQICSACQAHNAWEKSKKEGLI